MFVDAQPSDAERLTEIAISSKAYWGYTDEQMDSWKEDLTILPSHFDEWRGKKFVVKDKIAGFYLLNRVNARTCILEFLFVEPNSIGKGLGKQLIEHAIEGCRNNNCEVLNVLSDPNAESFYAKHGFKTIYRKKSSIPGRFLPEMELHFLENM